MSSRHELTTKERIFDAAEELMLEKSFHSVGLNELLAAVKVPKGSFYHHFDSKEHFGIEMLRHYISEGCKLKAAWLEDATQFPDPSERLFRYLEAGMGKFVECGCRPICLVLKLCAEVSQFSDGMRQELAAGFAKWNAIFERVIREGQKAGSIKRSLDAKAAATLGGDVWLGAMLRAQAMRNVAPLREAISFLRQFLKP